MSDPARPPQPKGDAAESGDAREPGDSGTSRWHGLMTEMGAEIAMPLTAAIERLHTLTRTGRIDRDTLRQLRDEVEAARQSAMLGQQLARFASGRMRLSHERLDLAEVTSDIVVHRSRETQARGVQMTTSLTAAEVWADPPLLFSLVNTVLDWALASAGSQIEIATGPKQPTTQALLHCRFAHRPLDELVDGPDPHLPAGLDSLAWRLIEQTASTIGVNVDRRDQDGSTALVFEFARIASDPAEAVSALDLNDGFALSSNSQPLAGSHVLVIASRREMRLAIRDALRGMSLLVDFVSWVDEAAAFCREGLPHAIVVESIQTGERFSEFRREVLAEVPGFAFIEVIEEGDVFEMSGFGGDGRAMARVGRDALPGALPSALMFELAKGQ